MKNGLINDEIIFRCLELKEKIITSDPFEKNERRYLNFGHTFGHAYEYLTKSSHGMSVLWGINYIDKNF